MKYIISFIVPVYNGSPWIERCINSLKEQTYSSLEIWIINDGSTDDSLEKAYQCIGADHRCHVLSIPHSGLSAARNQGLLEATGEYIGFLDIDDWLEPEFSQILLDHICRYHADIASCNSVSSSGMAPCKRIASYSTQQYLPQDYLAAEYDDPEINVRVGNKLYSRKLFDQVAFPVGKLYEDIVTNYLLCRQSQCMVHINLPLHNYFTGNISITRSPLQQRDMDLLIQWRTVRRMVQTDYPSLEPKVLSMEITALRSLSDKYLKYGGSSDLKKQLIHLFRSYSFLVFFSKEIPRSKKIRSLAGAIHLSLYKRVTAFIRKDS